MKAIVKAHAGSGAQLLEVPEPQITAHDHVKIRTLATSICGTDYHIYQWDAWSAQRVRTPRIMGHEFAGEVVEVGAEVTELKVGDYVSGESHWVCGKCLQCRMNQRHVCANTRILGVDVDGCFAPYVVVPEASLWKNNRTVPPHLACVQDPLGNAVHATLAADVVGAKVAILGCGPIGIFAVAVARAAGAALIYATDVHDYRLEIAKQLGAHVVVNVSRQHLEQVVKEGTAGEGVDVALEMSGAPSAIQQALRICRRGGHVSLMGIPSQPVQMDLAEELIFKGITVHGIVGRRLYETWNAMQSLLASGRLDIAPAITHQLPFNQFEKGMALMQEGRCGKVVFLMDA